MRLTIRAKLLLTFFAATVVGLALLALAVVAPIIMIWNRAAPTGVSFAQMVHLMEGRYNEIQDAIRRGDDTAALRRLAVPDDLPESIRVQLIDPEGLVLVDSTGQEGRRLTAAEMLTWFRGVRSDSSQALALPQPLAKSDGSLWGYYLVDIPGFATMNITIGDGSPEGALAGWLMGGGALLALVVTLLLFWFFGLHLVRPVRRLSDVVGRIAGGDLSARSNLGKRRDELGQLARDVDLRSPGCRRQASRPGRWSGPAGTWWHRPPTTCAPRSRPSWRTLRPSGMACPTTRTSRWPLSRRRGTGSSS